jgi:hypothetical protein
MSDPLEVNVSVFPDTGHHLFFKGFSSLPAAVSQLCASDSDPWAVVPQALWLRYRWGRMKQDQEGLFVAVETNLGSTNRGWVYKPRQSLESHEDAASPNGEPNYAAPGARALPKEPHGREFIDSKTSLPIRILLHWKVPIAAPIDVDLIIDFGNTRSMVIGLERKGVPSSLSDISRAISFLPEHQIEILRDTPEESVQATEAPLPERAFLGSVIDSWFLLKESRFSNLEPLDRNVSSRSVLMPQIEYGEVKEGLFGLKKTKKAIAQAFIYPHMFADYSIAQLGGTAQNLLTTLDLRRGGNYFMSSPKRYLWDTDPVGEMATTGATEWTMVLNHWNPESNRVQQGYSNPAKLRSFLLRFMYIDGKDWTLGDEGNRTPPNEQSDPFMRPFPDPDRPIYPRSEAMVWTALALLETAGRQINSKHWHDQLGQPGVPRRLRSISVTYPPGWSGMELDLYRAKWQKAVDIFALTRFSNLKLTKDGGDRPQLLMEIDEAVASQLPFVFGEIRQFENHAHSWLHSVGRGAPAKVRILNVDIGGGTTDTAIVEYSNNSSGEFVNLKAELLFRDSSTVAGDHLVKRIIENVLLPAISLRISGDPAKMAIFNSMMHREKGAQRSFWNRITISVFVPIVRWWLHCLSDKSQDFTTAAMVPPRDMQTPMGARLVNEDVLGRREAPNYPQTFNGLCESEGLGPNFLPYDEHLNFDPDRLIRCVDLSFAPLFRSLAKIVDAFDCDLVLASGKPSEIPRIRDLLESALPILPHRIFSMKGMNVGRWYPFSGDGVIHDAKSVTVAGAALFQAIRNHLIHNWSIETLASPNLFHRNYWGTLTSSGRLGFSLVLLQPGDDDCECDLFIGAAIGRQMLQSETRPEPVYRLVWKDRSRYGSPQGVNAALRVGLSRKYSKDRITEPERLELTSVVGTYQEQQVTLSDVQLKLYTLDSTEHWMERGVFEVLQEEET